MKKIIDIRKNKGMFHIQMSDDTLILYPEIYYKHRLVVDMVLSNQQLIEIQNEQDYLYYNQLGIKKLKKQLTSKEMESYFLSLNVSQKLIKQLIFSYQEKGYLNDEYYASSYIKQKAYIEGPNLIFEKLKEKGISPHIIAQLLGEINQREIIFVLMEKKIKTIKNKSKKQTLSLLKQHFLIKGFHAEIIDQVLLNQKDQIQSDTLFDIEMIYPKLIRQLKKKYKGQELNYHLKQKLYQKGYSMELIETFLINKMKELS